MALLPVVAVTLDYAQNICTVTVMARYRPQTPVLAELATLVTAGKWLTLSASFMVGIGVIIGPHSTVVRTQYAPAPGQSSGEAVRMQ